MATFGIKVFKHHEKKDGTFNVKIRVTKDRKTAYIDTNHYVTAKKLSKDYEVRDTTILKELYITIEHYRESVTRLGEKTNYMNANDIKAFLEKKSEKVDFLAFCRQHIDLLVSGGRSKTATSFRTVRYSLIDFIGGSNLRADDITPHFLMAYERFLRQPRKIKRLNQFGREVTISSKGLSDAGVHNYLRDFKGLYTAAQTYYNKPSLGIMPIPFHPFKEYKLAELPETRKRNITIEQLRAIKKYKPVPGGRVELAHDLFMLSFYLCGMNAVDLYSCGFFINNDRLEYQRSKTKGKRKDHAFISIRIPETALPLIEKYRDRLQGEYSEIGNLNKALNKGLKIIGESIGVPDLSFYWARHTFGNLARNKCRKSKDDVALALNHVDQGRKTTDIYLEKDWSIVDEVQAAVLALIAEPKIADSAQGPRQILQNFTPPMLIGTESHQEEAMDDEITKINPDQNRKTMCLVSA
jgi:integrase